MTARPLGAEDPRARWETTPGMLSASWFPARDLLDEWVPVLSVPWFATGTVVSLGGMVSGNLLWALVGGAIAALGLVFLMAGEWVDPLLALSLSLPLPALYAAGGLRLAPALPLTGLVIAAWIVAWPSRRIQSLPARLPLGWMVLFLSVLAFTALLSEHKVPGAREVANMGILLALLAVAGNLIAQKPERARRLAWCVALTAAFVGGLAALETTGVLPGRFPEPNGFNRAALGFGQPNGLGMFLALSLPFTLYIRQAAKTPAARWIGGLAVLLTVTGIVGTFSRGAWLSVFAGAAVLPLAGERRTALRIWGLGLAFALAADVLLAGAIRDNLFDLLQDWSVTQRAALMLAGVQMFIENPLAGVGPGGFGPELERIGALVPSLWDLQDTPHNAYVQMAAEAGVLGLGSFLALLSSLLRQAVLGVKGSIHDPEGRSLRIAILWGIGIALAEGFVEWPFSHGQGQLVMLTAAMACALPRSAEPKCP